MKTKLIIIGILLLCVANVLAQGGGKAEPNRIKFAKGKSSATMNGTLLNNQEMEYIFGARAGQTVTLNVVSVSKGSLFTFSIDSANGIELETDYDSYAGYTFTAPETGDYLVTVVKRPTEKNQKAKFSLPLPIK